MYAQYHKSTDGCDGAIAGINGSINAPCLAVAMQALQLKDRKFVDLGCGDGRVLICATAVFGASSSIGYELPQNSAHEIVFEAVKNRMAKANAQLAVQSGQCLWQAQDIDDLKCMQGADAVYSFWVGMPKITQLAILRLVRESSVTSLYVFQDDKWRDPAAITNQLNLKPTRGRLFVYVAGHNVRMMGSGERKTGWMFELEVKN